MTSHLASVLIALLAFQSSVSNAAEASTEAPASVSGSDEKASGEFLPKEQRAPVAYESPNGGVIFKANVSGRDVWAMLDTGSTRSLMDIELARSIGLDLGAQEKTVITPNGEISMQRVSNVQVEVPGQIRLRFPKLSAGDLSAAATAVGRKVEFILGSDLLQALVLIVDPSKHTFQFGPSGIFNAPAQSIEVSLRNDKPPQIEVTIGDQKALVTISTGFRGQLALTTAAWARIVPKASPAASADPRGTEGHPAEKRFTLGEIEIGSLRLNDVEARESKMAQEGDGVLGAGILGRFRLALDIKKGKMWLLPSPPATVGK